MNNNELQELAKLVKEKGFKTHTVTTGYTFTYLLGGKNIMINETCKYLFLCEIQKWLREVYNIDIGVYRKHKDLGKFYGGDIFSDTIRKSYGSNFKTYEEALEIGLQKALKEIK